jgi:hypothetical protein
MFVIGQTDGCGKDVSRWKMRTNSIAKVDGILFENVEVGGVIGWETICTEMREREKFCGHETFASGLLTSIELRSPCAYMLKR